MAYVRGDSAKRVGENPNPALDPNGVEQDVWFIALDGFAPRKIGQGHLPAVSARGNRARRRPPRGRSAPSSVARAVAPSPRKKPGGGCRTWRDFSLYCS
jgi:hypothetical protein